MDISQHLGAGQILLHIRAKDKWDMLDQMIEALAKGDVCRKQKDGVREKIGPAVIKRERQYATGLGGGFAFPHGRVPGFSGLALCLGVLDEPIEYGSPDDKDVQIVCMVVTPEEDPTVGVRAMGALSALLSDEAVKHYFLSEPSPEKIYDYIVHKRLSVHDATTARDIMRTPLFEVHADTPLRKVVHMMLLHRVEAVSVTDPEGRILGQITCNTLFKRGMPDFFSQLTSVSFIKYFDPFEKYFAEEAHALAGDVMTGDFATVDEHSTLMEIVFLLAIQNHPKLYVLRDGCKVGIIDRNAVLDRILNL